MWVFGYFGGCGGMLNNWININLVNIYILPQTNGTYVFILSLKKSNRPKNSLHSSRTTSPMPARRAKSQPKNVPRLSLSCLHQEEPQDHQIQNQKGSLFLHLQGWEAQCHPSHRKRTRKGCRKDWNQEEKSCSQKGQEMIKPLFKHHNHLYSHHIFNHPYLTTGLSMFF